MYWATAEAPQEQYALQSPTNSVPCRYAVDYVDPSVDSVPVAIGNGPYAYRTFATTVLDAGTSSLFVRRVSKDRRAKNLEDSPGSRHAPVTRCVEETPREKYLIPSTNEKR